MTKDHRQDIGLLRYLKAGGIGTYHYVQRFGKTLSGLKVMKRFSTNKPKGSIIVLVPSAYIKGMWVDEISRFGYTFNNVTVISAASAILQDSINCDLLIVDEIHKFTSKERIKLINKTIINYTFILGLTGSYPNDSTISKYAPVIDTITEAEAIEEGWISKFIEYNIGLELTEADKVEYAKYSTIMFEVMSTFKGLNDIIKNNDGTPFFTSDLDLIISCYRGKSAGKNQYIQSTYIREVVASKMGWEPDLDLSSGYNKQREDYWNPDAIKDRCSNYYKAMRSRSLIHNYNEVKLKAVLEIYARFNSDTIMIFSENAEFADVISDAINNKFKTNKAVSYHSTIDSKPLKNFINNKLFRTKAGVVKKFGKKKQLDYIVSMLKIGYYTCISTVKALDEGFNVDNINLIITTSGTANPTQYSQRSARGKTIDRYNINKRTVIINLYFDDFMTIVDGEYRQFMSRDKAKLYYRIGDRRIKELNLDEFFEYI